jgi:hypothetical protein
MLQSALIPEDLFLCLSATSSKSANKSNKR